MALSGPLCKDLSPSSLASSAASAGARPLLPASSVKLRSSASAAAVRCSSAGGSFAPRQRRWAAPNASAVASPESAASSANLRPENVREASTREAFDAELRSAADGNKLLVVEFTKQSLPNSDRAHQALVELTDTTPDVLFLRAFVDQSADLRALGTEQDVKQIPSYVFFRDGRPVHQCTGLKQERLREEVLYYGQAQYPVRQLSTVEELDGLLQEQSVSDRLVVVQVTLNFCGPCVRVYPAVLQMSHKMKGEVVFARLFGDANKGTEKLLSELNIVEAPTFLFYRNSALLGRYVGSGKGELVGEVLRYQGVQCT